LALGQGGHANPVLLEDPEEGLFHVPRRVGPDVFRRICSLKPGQRMQDLPEELWHRSFLFYVKHDPMRQGGPNLRMIRLDPDRPALTVTGYVFNKFVHPFQDRFITPREAARLQDIPDDFRFVGTLTSVQQQVGNAVPVRLAAALARAVVEHAMDTSSLTGYADCANGWIPALSLFTGIGGMDLGFGESARRESGFGFRPLACVELDQDCCATLARNGFGDVTPTDITCIRSARQFLHRLAGEWSVPMVFGGPPCQAFSQAGKQKGTGDDRGRLIFEYARFIEELRPVYFVMENVSNLRGVAGGRLFNSIMDRFARSGYNVRVHRLCAADFGTPQLRVRLFFVGVEDKYPPVGAPTRSHGELGELPLSVPTLRPYATVRDAFAGLP